MARPSTEDRETAYWLPNWKPLTEVECREMAAGRVPEWLRDTCRAMVDWTLETGAMAYVSRREVQQHRKSKRVAG